MSLSAKSGRMSEAARLAVAGSLARLPERFAGRTGHVTADAAQPTFGQRPNPLEVAALTVQTMLSSAQPQSA